AAIALAFFAWLGVVTGWRGPPRTAISTAVWPFYFDTWIRQTVWSWRVAVPLAGLALAWLPLRRFLDDGRARWLLALLVCAWGIELTCAAVRWGFADAYRITFARPQEYWWDVR